MKSLNRVQLIGISPRDVEIKNNGNMRIANFTLATHRKKKDGEEVTSWHRCVAFDYLADYAAECIKKGSKVFVEGSLQYDEYIPKGSEEKREIAKIIVNYIAMTQKAEQKEEITQPYKKSYVMEEELPF